MSRLVIHKYGGSSVANMKCLHQVAEIIATAVGKGDRVVAVVSAMRGQSGDARGASTDELLDLALAASAVKATDGGALDLYKNEDTGREVDALVALGEMFTAPLLALVLQSRGIGALSLHAGQAGVKVRGDFGSATIIGASTDRIEQALDAGKVPVLAGFQGINEAGDFITMGRGCSDTSAVAIAAAMRADECLIYTDVNGIYTADPRVVPEARPLAEVSFEEMIEASLAGARVLNPRSVRLAQHYGVPLRVLPTFAPDQPGTRIGNG